MDAPTGEARVEVALGVADKHCLISLTDLTDVTLVSNDAY